jgi:hypothetical protein
MNDKIQEFLHKLSNELEIDALELSESNQLDKLTMFKIKKMSEIFYPYWIKLVQQNESINQNEQIVIKINELLSKAMMLKRQWDESKLIFQDKTLREIERINSTLGFDLIEVEELDQIKFVFLDENQSVKEVIDFLSNEKMASSLCRIYNNDLLKQKLSVIEI